MTQMTSGMKLLKGLSVERKLIEKRRENPLKGTQRTITE